MTVLLIPTFLITLTQVTIYQDSINITKCSILGVVTKNYDITVKNVLSMTTHEDILELDDSAIYNADDSFDFFVLLSPTRELVTNLTKFIYKDERNEEKSLTVKVKAYEYKLAWDTLNGQMH